MNKTDLVKKAAIGLSILVSVGLISSPVLAQSASPVPAAKAQRIAQRESNLKTRADNEITRRLTSLNNILTKVAALKRLSSDQKSAFTTQIQTEITNLTNLKTKIDADSDITTLQADVKSIVTSYRVYALFIPQIHLLVASDNMLDVTDTLTQIATKLQTRIQTDQSAGKDVSSLQTSLTDLQNKIADAKTQANQVISLVTPLTPDGYPGNKSTMQQALAVLKTGRQDLQAARNDAKTIIQGLRALGGTKSASSSAGQ